MNKKLDFKGHQKYPKTLKQICIKSVSVTRKEEKSQLHQKRVIKVYFLIKVLYVPGLNVFWLRILAICSESFLVSSVTLSYKTRIISTW